MAEPRFTPAEEALLDRMAREILERRLETPAIFLLESLKPLSFVGSQAMHFLSPLVGIFFGGPGWDEAARLLEKREALEALIVRLEDGLDARESPPPEDGDVP